MLTPAEEAATKSLIGKRVLMGGKHICAGHSGEIIGWESTPWGYRPRVRLDNGMETFVFEPSDGRVLQNAVQKGRRRR